jgi:PAS domain S-box-containing protein
MPLPWFALLSLFNAVLAFFLAGFVYHLNPRKTPNRVFSLFCLTVSAWAFAEFMLRQAESPAAAGFWLHVSGFWPFILATLLHFLLAYTYRRNLLKNPLLYLGIYLPAALFTGLSCTDRLTTDLVHTLWGYMRPLESPTGLSRVAALWAVAAGLSCVGICLVNWYRTKKPRDRKNAQYLAVAIMVPVAVSFFSETLRPLFHLNIPDLSSTSFSWLAVIITYTIWRFELFSLDPAATADKIIATMSEPLLIVDTYGAITHPNQAAVDLFGYSREELTARFFSALFVTAESGAITLNKILLGESVFHHEVQLKSRDGDQRYALISSSVLRDREGEIAGFICILKDITERLQTENRLKTLLEDLQRSNTELEQLAYVASHDLQEPLRMVSSYLELLERRYKDRLDQDAREFIGFAVDGAKRMKRLIEDLLTFSRLGTRARPFSPVNMEAVLEKALLNLKVIREETGTRITHDPLPVLPGDESQLIQLLQNLLANALKFHGSLPSRVHLGAQRVNAAETGVFSGTESLTVWKFSVADNGIGIPPEHFSRIFQLFQRLHSRAEYPGSGIGLAVCKKIVERHHGKIWVESEIGKGSTFYFILPE